MINLSDVGLQNQDHVWRQPKKTARWQITNNNGGRKTEETAIKLLEIKIDSLVLELEQTKQKLNESGRLPKALINEFEEYKEKKVKMEMACQPTVSNLSQTLEKARKIAWDFDLLQGNINALISDATITAKNGLERTANHEELKTKLEEYDNTYDTYINAYKDLMPVVNNALSELDSSIAKATHEAFSEKQLIAFSAKQSIPLKEIESNNVQFDSELNSCKELFKKLIDDRLAVQMGLNTLKNELNNTDHRIVVLKTNSWNFTYSYWGEKNRLSPLDKTFNLEKPVVVAEAVAQAI